MNLQWDYTTLAETYDDRADYNQAILQRVFDLHNLEEKATILDCGAGTGKLTKELVKRYSNVIASEPNEAMRKKGIDNLKNSRCTWVHFPAEKMEIPDDSISSVWFGSSFNVVDHNQVFKEFTRYSKSKTWLTALWNHRDLDDKLQRSIEEIFLTKIKNFNYGSRRQDPSPIINHSGLFGEILKFEAKFIVRMKTSSYIDAWKSHATLKRQCRNEQHFEEIIEEINSFLVDVDQIDVPYTTRLWTCLSLR
jgi:ubiquinone/menaquinone biosynthesis C-methylase UbiE